jgi:hypothetical protein
MTLTTDLDTPRLGLGGGRQAIASELLTEVDPAATTSAHHPSAHTLMARYRH